MEDLEVILDDIESQEAEVTDLNYIPDYQVYEQERRENEAERIANENERKDNEVTRVGNEETRVDNESTRVGNESDRVTAEGLRVSAEEGRVEAEADRVLAEEHREEVINSLSDVATSGSYNDLSDKPYIPENTSDLTNDSGYITKDVNNLTYYTIKTSTGSLIDLEINSTTYVVTLKLKDIDGNVISTDTIDLPLENVVVSGRYDNATKKVILTLQNGSEVSFSVADLVSGLQTEITNDNKIASDLVDDSNSGHKFVTTTEKSTWNAKQNAIDSSHKLSSDLVDDSGTNKFVSASDITNWNGKYAKPSGGIPKTDLASAVQTTLDAVSGKEDTSNKVSTIDENSTNTQYPGAKCVYDSQVAQDNLITQLQAENDYLNSVIEQAFDETTQTGETISLDNTIQAKMKVGLNGNTSQVSYTGKNTFNILDSTITGATITTNNDIDFDYVPTTTSNRDYPVVCKTNTSYTFSAKVSTTIGADFYIYFLYSDNTSENVGSLSGSGIQSETITKTSNASKTLTGISFRHYNIGSYNKYKISEPILAKGSTIGDYEPYVGGTPSPNPSYPQPIQVVSGDNEVSVCGKNLANINNINNSSTTDRKMTITNDTIVIENNSSLNGYANTFAHLSVICPNLRVGDVVYLSFDTTSSAANKNIVYVGTSWVKGSSKTITQEMLDSNVILYGGYNEIAVISNFMITKINNATYEPYTGTIYPINLGTIELCKIGDYQDKFFKAIESKNLVDYTKNTISNSYIRTAQVDISSVSDGTTFWVEVEPNTQYTFSRDKGNRLIIGASNTKPSLNGSLDTILYDGGTSTAKTYTFTNGNYKYLAIYVSLGENTQPTWVQLEKGATATEYVPYNDGAWYLKKNIGKVVLDGSEDVAIYITPDTTRRIFGVLNATSDIEPYINSGDLPRLISNYFIPKTQSATWSIGTIARRNTSTAQYTLYFSVANNPSIDEFKSWLSTHNTIVYYVLATPTYTKIEGTLASQLDTLYNAMSKKVQTNITQVNNDKPFIIDAWALTKD